MRCRGKGVSIDTPITTKQWQRRALKAEAELEIIHQLRAHEGQQEMAMARELARFRVSAREVQEATEWALGFQS